MVSEETVNRVYEEALAFVEDLMGKDTTTSNHELDKCGRALFGDMYAGALPPSQLPPPAPHQVLILNTKGGVGEHWLLRYCDANRGLWYDSFGRDVSGLVRTKYVRASTDGDAEQNILESNCGQRCLAAAIVGRLLGAEALQKL